MKFSPSKFMIGALSAFAVLQVVGALAALKSPPRTPLTAEQLSDPRNIEAKIPSDPSKNCWWFEKDARWMTGKDCLITSNVDAAGRTWYKVHPPANKSGEPFLITLINKDSAILQHLDGTKYEMKVEKHPVLGYRVTGGNDYDMILRLS